MSLEEIKSKILTEAQAEAAAIEAAARTEARQIIERANQAAKREREAILDRARRQSEAAQQAAEVEQAMAEQKDVLGLKQSLIAEAFDRAGQKLLAWPDPSYEKFLGALLKTLPKDFQVKAIDVPFQKKGPSQKIVQGSFPSLAQDQIKVRPDLGGGLYLSGPAYDVDLTWARLAEELKNSLAGQVGQIIFPYKSEGAK